jgi:ankyrin repeat protein
MKKILLSLLLAGGVQNSFVMGSYGGGRAAQGGGQAAESSFRLEGQVPVAFEDGSVVYLDLQRLKALNSGLLERVLFTADGSPLIKELSESNPFAMTRFENLADFEKFEKILQGQLSGEIADKLAFIEHVDFLDIDWLKHLRELKDKNLQKFFVLYTALLADKIDLEEPRPVKHDFIILLKKVFPNLLVEATKSNEFEAAKMLIATGADVNVRDLDGRTALMMSAKNDYTEIAQLLITAGADVNARDDDGETALMWATEDCYTEIIKLFIAAGDDVDARNSNGATLLMIAAKNGYTEIAQLLIAAGANVDASTPSGNTALMCTVLGEGRHTEISQLLITAGADVNARDNDGETALIFAARNGNTQLVQLLIASGADVNASDNYGETVLMIVVRKGYTEIEKLLRDSGAR